MERLASHTGPWPLRQAGFEVKRPWGPTFRFTPTDEVVEGNLYLWALALRQEATWAPVFGARGRIPLVKASELAPTCWEIAVLPPI